MANINTGAAVLGSTTCLMAFLDGGLTAMACAALVGGASYISTRRSASRTVTAVLESQITQINNLVDKEAEESVACLGLEGKAHKEALKAKKAELRKIADEKIDEARSRALHQMRGNHTPALLAGIGGFACPPAGAVILVYTNRDRIMPRLKAAAAAFKRDDDFVL